MMSVKEFYDGGYVKFVPIVLSDWNDVMSKTTLLRIFDFNFKTVKCKDEDGDDLWKIYVYVEGCEVEE